VACARFWPDSRPNPAIGHTSGQWARLKIDPFRTNFTLEVAEVIAVEVLEPALYDDIYLAMGVYETARGRQENHR
jgi:hypothetical protein